VQSNDSCAICGWRCALEGPMDSCILLDQSSSSKSAKSRSPTQPLLVTWEVHAYIAGAALG
jgi:hypothetical protein